MLHSAVFARIPARLDASCRSFTSSTSFNSFTSASLSPLPHLTPLFPLPSALFSVIAPRQLPCFQYFANSFPTHGGCTPKHGWSARSMLRSSPHEPCALLSHQKSQSGRAIQKRPSKPGIRSGYESSASAAAKGPLFRSDIRRRRDALLSDSFCHFKKSSSTLSMCCALFDEKTGVGCHRRISGEDKHAIGMRVLPAPALPWPAPSLSESERADRSKIPAPAGKDL